MLGLDHHADAFGGEGVHDGGGHLVGEPLLDLEAAGEEVDDPRELADAEHLAFGDIANVALSKEGQHVVLAQAVELDVADDDHVVVFDGEDGIVDDLLQILSIALGQELHGLGGAVGGVDQPLAGGVLSDF